MRSAKLVLFLIQMSLAAPVFAQNPQPAASPQPTPEKPADLNGGFLPAASATPTPPPAPKAEIPSGVGIFAGLLDPFDYDPRGRRDPFAQPVSEVPMTPGAVRGPLLPLQEFEVAQLRLTGILWDVRHPKAMIKDPSGKLHIVGPNAKLGPHNGYIAVIREGELVVVETIEQEGRLVSTAQVVKIAK